MDGSYWEHLRTAVGSAVAPYGYTLATWTTGAVLMQAYGLPATVDALLFMGGAVLAFALVGMVAFGGVTTEFAHAPSRAPLWGSFHFFSVGGAIGTTVLATYLFSGHIGWLLTPFASTATYLLILGVQVSVGHGRERRHRA
ncbi:MAG: hypothetical protein ACFB50_16840 [Rubrobacteraceae bacterium]